MQRWNLPSELFLRRHLNMLANAGILVGIGVFKLQGFSEWRGVPIYGFNWGRPYRKYGRMMLRAFLARRNSTYLSLEKDAALRHVLKETGANTILFEYGTMAVEFENVVKDAEQKIIIHTHGYDVEDVPTYKNYLNRLRSLANNATFISNSEFTRRRLIDNGIPENAIVVKYYGVEVPPTPIQREPTDEITILHLGRLIDWKGPDLTIKAFELACERGLNGKLIIAGDGDMRDVCQALRDESPWRDRIQLLGAVSAQEGVFRRLEADIFTQHALVSPHSGRQENFGVSIVEAMAAALPVVTCALGGIRETVVDGETGIFIEPGDIEAQANAFLTLANDPALR